MEIILASKTKQAIEDAIENDQGASFRTFLKQILPKFEDPFRGVEKNLYRSHLGASVIGKECDRSIWYGFRWFKKPSFSGRITRLFNRGHLEEPRVLASLMTIGVKIYQQDANGKQFRISDIGGHFGGSGDGVAIGIPDLPVDMPCLLEIKTHSDKYFKELVKQGVKLAKPEHYVQMQIYMNKMGLGVALYCAVNKNDDEYYFEIIWAEQITPATMIERARIIIMSSSPPQKINNSPSWYQCKCCDYQRICHFGVEPERNCRTCHFSRPIEDGTWQCVNPICPGTLSEEDQLKGCSWHERK